jgi:hypothetical protein
MSDEQKITAVGLRIVRGKGETPTRPRRQLKREFAQINLVRFDDPIWRRRIPAWLRLYSIIQHRTKRGTRNWMLTNDDAAAAGLNRQHKYRALRELEAMRLVRVARQGRRNPEVTLVLPGLL